MSNWKIKGDSVLNITLITLYLDMTAHINKLETLVSAFIQTLKNTLFFPFVHSVFIPSSWAILRPAETLLLPEQMKIWTDRHTALSISQQLANMRPLLIRGRLGRRMLKSGQRDAGGGFNTNCPWWPLQQVRKLWTLAWTRLQRSRRRSAELAAWNSSP